MVVGQGEFIIVLILALFLFGPKKLPELARSLGRAAGEYQKAVREFKNEAYNIEKEPAVLSGALTEKVTNEKTEKPKKTNS
jgi:sec-independent protein translocase protein TatA